MKIYPVLLLCTAEKDKQKTPPSCRKSNKTDPMLSLCTEGKNHGNPPHQVVEKARKLIQCCHYELKKKE